MAKLTYVKGDATNPIGDGNNLIVHVCNDGGAFGSGFAGAVARIWPDIKRRYHKWFENDAAEPFKLGRVQFCRISPFDTLCIANMIAQSDCGGVNIKVGQETVHLSPIRYESLHECMLRVASFCLHYNYSIHAPKFGSGLAEGNWERIEEMIRVTWVKNNINVTIYEL